MDEAHDAAVRKLLNNAPIPFKLVTETLFKVLTNIINNPDEPKYCELKRDSATFTEKISSCAGGLAFLKASGFVADGEVMRIQPPIEVERLRRTRAVLKEAVRAYGEECVRRTQEQMQRENAEAAGKLRELQDANRKHRSKSDIAAATERESIMRGVQIDRADWERQRDPTNLK